MTNATTTVTIDIYHAGPLHGLGRWATEDVAVDQIRERARSLRRQYQMTYGHVPRVEIDGTRWE